MAQPPPPPLTPPPSSSSSSSPIPCQVRCAGCRTILNVAPGVSEFVCPNCKMPQMLPPELTGPPPQPASLFSTPPPPTTAPLIPPLPQLQNRPPVQAHGIDPTKIQLPCANCKAILNVPHGLARFACPQCGVELFVPLRLLPEEVNEVIIMPYAK